MGQTPSHRVKNGTQGKVGTLHLKKLESLSPKDALYQVWLKLAQWFWRRNLNPHHPRMLCAKFVELAHWFWWRRLLNFVKEFRYFVIISSRKRAGPSFEQNYIMSPSPKDAVCQVCLKLAQWFWIRKFFEFVNVFSQFRKYLPLEKDGGGGGFI